jgi:hypothetical protein
VQRVSACSKDSHPKMLLSLTGWPLIRKECIFCEVGTEF